MSLPCVKEGGTRSVTEGACVNWNLYWLYCSALSLGRPRQAAGASSLPEGTFFMFTYDLSIFLTSTAFVSTNARIRHTSFEIYRISENCPLEHCSNELPVFLCFFRRFLQKLTRRFPYFFPKISLFYVIILSQPRKAAFRLLSRWFTWGLYQSRLLQLLWSLRESVHRSCKAAG